MTHMVHDNLKQNVFHSTHIADKACPAVVRHSPRTTYLCVPRSAVSPVCSTVYSYKQPNVLFFTGFPSHVTCRCHGWSKYIYPERAVLENH